MKASSQSCCNDTWVYWVYWSFFRSSHDTFISFRCLSLNWVCLKIKYPKYLIVSHAACDHKISIDMACLRYPTFSDPKSWHNTRGRTPVCHVLRNVWLVTGPSHHHLAKIPLGPLCLWQKMELHMGIGQNYRDEHPFRSNKALTANSCLNLRMYLGFDVWIALNNFFDG